MIDLDAAARVLPVVRAVLAEHNLVLCKVGDTSFPLTGDAEDEALIALNDAALSAPTTPEPCPIGHEHWSSGTGPTCPDDCPCTCMVCR